jgi:hypothetical protein
MKKVAQLKECRRQSCCLVKSCALLASAAPRLERCPDQCILGRSRCNDNYTPKRSALLGETPDWAS